MATSAGKTIVVVGGANLDIGGVPFKPLIPADSNPGTVRLSAGGVGRNIAHNLALLGARVQLATVFGQDAAGGQLRQSCEDAGIGLSLCQTLRRPGAVYLFITEPGGEMELALSDMEICREMTPAWLAARMDAINRAALCVADTNLPAEALQYLARHCTVPLVADPVSTTKAEKLPPALGRLHTLKPNRIEAALLSGVPTDDEAGLAAAASALLAKGLQRVFITLGPEGVYCAEKGQSLRLPIYAGPLANTTGAGDAFTAALALCTLQNQSLAATAKTALAAAAIAVAARGTIAPQLNSKAVETILQTGRYTPATAT